MPDGSLAQNSSPAAFEDMSLQPGLMPKSLNTGAWAATSGSDTNKKSYCVTAPGGVSVKCGWTTT